MEPELDSIAVDDKTAQSGKERVFHFPRVPAIGGWEMKRSRGFQVLQRFWIREEHRDAIRCDVSIDDGVDQRRPKHTPSPAGIRFLREARYKLPF